MVNLYTLSAWGEFWSFGWVTDTWNNVTDAVNGFFNWFGDTFTNFFYAITNGFDSAISFLQTLADWVGTIFENLVISIGLMYDAIGIGGPLQNMVFPILSTSIFVVIALGVIKTVLGR